MKRSDGVSSRKGVYSISDDIPSRTAGVSGSPPPGHCDLSEICRDAVSSTRRLWDKPGRDGQGCVTVKTYLRSVRPVAADRDEIREMLTALIINSIEAMPGGGDLYLTVAEYKGFANVYIQDSGGGISESIREKIFEPFFTTKDGFKRGLGLTRALETVRRHGGMFEVLSRKGGGATFIIRLPLAPVQMREEAVPRNNLRNFKVLLVAREGLIKDLLFRFISADGAILSMAHTAVEGKKLFRKHSFDIVIAEDRLVSLDRTGFLSFVKSEYPETAFVVLAARETAGKPGRSVAGVDSWIRPPINMDKLFPMLCDTVAVLRAKR